MGNTGMVEQNAYLGLMDEEINEGLVRVQMGQELLDRNETACEFRFGGRGHKDVGHAPLGNLGVQEIVSKATGLGKRLHLPIMPSKRSFKGAKLH